MGGEQWGKNLQGQHRTAQPHSAPALPGTRSHAPVMPAALHAAPLPTSKSSGQLLLLLLLLRFSRLSRLFSSWGGGRPHCPAPETSSPSISSTCGEEPLRTLGLPNSSFFFTSFSQSPEASWGCLAGVCASAGSAGSSKRASLSRSSRWTRLPVSSLGECRRGSESRRKQQGRVGPPGAPLSGKPGWAASSRQGSWASGAPSKVSGKKSPDPAGPSAGCWRQVSLCWRHNLLCRCLLWGRKSRGRSPEGGALRVPGGAPGAGPARETAQG